MRHRNNLIAVAAAHGLPDALRYVGHDNDGVVLSGPHARWRHNDVLVDGGATEHASSAVHVHRERVDGVHGVESAVKVHDAVAFLQAVWAQERKGLLSGLPRAHRNDGAAGRVRQRLGQGGRHFQMWAQQGAVRRRFAELGRKPAAVLRPHGVGIALHRQPRHLARGAEPLVGCAVRVEQHRFLVRMAERLDARHGRKVARKERNVLVRTKVNDVGARMAVGERTSAQIHAQEN